jgi:hypothetical protein
MHTLDPTTLEFRCTFARKRQPESGVNLCHCGRRITIPDPIVEANKARRAMRRRVILERHTRQRRVTKQRGTAWHRELRQWRRQVQRATRTQPRRVATLRYWEMERAVQELATFHPTALKLESRSLKRED